VRGVDVVEGDGVGRGLGEGTVERGPEVGGLGGEEGGVNLEGCGAGADEEGAGGCEVGGVGSV
jgi:hypothetical protein